jgi:hypothetical protein
MTPYLDRVELIETEVRFLRDELEKAGGMDRRFHEQWLLLRAVEAILLVVEEGLAREEVAVGLGTTGDPGAERGPGAREA